MDPSATTGPIFVPSEPTMRTIPSTLFAVLLTLQAGAQSAAEPPAKAVAHFSAKYPGAVVKEWERRKRNYRVEYTLKGVEYDSYYTPEGAWVRTEQEIGMKDLPPAVTAALKAGKYATWRVADLELHATAEQPKLYKVKVEQKGQAMELYYTPDGKLIKEKPDE